MAERNDLHDMSPEELELECQHLRDENHQLQLRILGVNELARLLQDRSELVQVLEEKNKRLEIAVVRLENRCANYDRTLKSQKVSLRVCVCLKARRSEISVDNLPPLVLKARHLKATCRYVLKLIVNSTCALYLLCILI